MLRLVYFRNKFYVYDRQNGKTQRISLRTADRAEADRRFADYQASLKRKATTVAEIFEDYMSEHGSRVASQETLQFAIKRLSPVFGHLRPDQIDRAGCRSYIAERYEQGVAAGTIRRELVVLNAALRWADKQTPALIEMPPAPPPKSRHLTREQYRALREAAKKVPHLHLFVVLAYTTAGRASAILDLSWDRVDFERGQIRLGLGERRTKGRATVPMTDGTRDVLTEFRRAAVSNFVVEYAGRKVGSVKRAFKAAAAKAGLPKDTSPHVLRHSAAVHMVERGVPMSEVAQYLGHSSTSVTERVYGRYSPDYLRKAASALEC